MDKTRETIVAILIILFLGLSGLGIWFLADRAIKSFHETTTRVPSTTTESTTIIEETTTTSTTTKVSIATTTVKIPNQTSKVISNNTTYTFKNVSFTIPNGYSYSVEDDTLVINNSAKTEAIGFKYKGEYWNKQGVDNIKSFYQQELDQLGCGSLTNTTVNNKDVLLSLCDKLGFVYGFYYSDSFAFEISYSNTKGTTVQNNIKLLNKIIN